MSKIICPSCNTVAAFGAIFCDNCGYDLRTVSAIDDAPIPPTQMVSGSGSAGIPCPNCGHNNLAGSAFCENCGTQLQQKSSPEISAMPAAAATPRDSLAETLVGEGISEGLSAPKLESIPGKLVIVENEISLPIPPGKQVVIGREDPVSGVFPDLDLDPHGGHEAGVGRRHAQLLLRNGDVFIEDLDSVNGTAVNKQRIEPRKPYPIKDGDEIRLGKMILNYLSK